MTPNEAAIALRTELASTSLDTIFDGNNSILHLAAQQPANRAGHRMFCDLLARINATPAKKSLIFLNASGQTRIDVAIRLGNLVYVTELFNENLANETQLSESIKRLREDFENCNLSVDQIRCILSQVIMTRDPRFIEIFCQNFISVFSGVILKLPKHDADRVIWLLIGLSSFCDTPQIPLVEREKTEQLLKRIVWSCPGIDNDTTQLLSIQLGIETTPTLRLL